MSVAHDKKDKPFLATKSSAARKLISVDDQHNSSSRLRTSAQVLAVKSAERDHTGPHPQRNFAARKNVSTAPPPVASARKYVQDGRRVMARKSAPKAALWAPSMRPLGPNYDPRSHVPPPLGWDHAQKQGTHHRLTKPPPSTQERFTAELSRKSIPLMGAPPHVNHPGHPQPRHSFTSYTTPSEIIARKSMQAIEPAWLTADATYTAALGRRRTRYDGGWMSVPSMSASRMVPASGARGTSMDASRMVDDVKAQIGPGLTYKLEGKDDSDDENEVDEHGDGVATTYQSKAARKYNQIAKGSRFTGTLGIGSARKGSNVRPVSPQESTSSDEKSKSESLEIDELEDSDIDSDKPLRTYIGRKSAMKSPRFAGTSGTTSSDERPESDIDELESDIDTDTTDKIPSPPEELMTALEALTLSSMQMQRGRQLPFLLRDLRRGFEQRCQLIGIPTSEEPRPVSATVVYKLRIDSGGVEFGGLGSSTTQDYMHKAHMAAWRCPLCELHREFKTREMLEMHLTWDHDRVNTTWEQLKGGKWQITLIIPEFTEEEEPSCGPLKHDSDSEESISLHSRALHPDPNTHKRPGPAVPTFALPSKLDPDLEESISLRSGVVNPASSTYKRPAPAVLSPALHSKQTTFSAPVVSTPVHTPQDFQVAPNVPPSVFPSTASATRPTEHRQTHTKQPLTPVSNVPSAAPMERLVQLTIQSPIPERPFTSPPPRIEVLVPSPSTSPIPTKFTSPTPSRLSSQSVPPRARSTTTSTTTTAAAYQRRQSAGRPSRYPTPPPPEDPLGPAAQYPYLPFTFDDEVHFSARPGGPRLYDLLNGLSMKRFGVLSWSVVDKEEEMFECDDVRDEDKVMQALWGRWIMLNRNKFVTNFYIGTMAFVDDYWRIIHRAAGWAALRTWLLMLVLNRFVTGSEIVKILQHYEQLTGMDYWYNEQEPEPEP